MNIAGTLGRFGACGLGILCMLASAGCFLPVNVPPDDPNTQDANDPNGNISPSGETILTIRNASSHTITSITIASAGSDVWSDNLITPPMEPNTSEQVGTFDNGSYDLKIVSDDPNFTWSDPTVSLTTDTFEFSLLDQGS
jgi:hypothetical protein